MSFDWSSSFTRRALLRLAALAAALPLLPSAARARSAEEVDCDCGPEGDLDCGECVEPEPPPNGEVNQDRVDAFLDELVVCFLEGRGSHWTIIDEDAAKRDVRANLVRNYSKWIDSEVCQRLTRRCCYRAGAKASELAGWYWPITETTYTKAVECIRDGCDGKVVIQGVAC